MFFHDGFSYGETVHCAGIRYNRRVAHDEMGTNLAVEVMDELSDLLLTLGKKLSSDAARPLPMVGAMQLLDIPEERIIEEPPMDDDIFGAGFGEHNADIDIETEESDAPVMILVDETNDVDVYAFADPSWG